MISVAYIGCGAVVQRSHLPALKLVDGLQAAAFADRDQNTLQLIGAEYPDAILTSDAEKAIQASDLIVIATPSGSHYQLAVDALSAGKHVLVEKPLALTEKQSIEMVELANSENRLLAVSLVRRLLSHNRLFKHLIDMRVVGQIQTVRVSEGSVFNWPVQSADFYDPELSGGGVLLDNGAHLLDLVLWWLGDASLLSYFDDSQGGVEAECRLDMQTKDGAELVVEMSRLRKLKNQIEVEGEKGMLKMDLASGQITLSARGAEEVFRGGVHGSLSNQTTLDLFVRQYKGIVEAIGSQDQHSSNIVKGVDSVASVSLIEQCYGIRQLLKARVI